MQCLPSDYTVVDLETTGLSPARDSIIEFAAVKIRDGLVVDQYSTLINPETSICREVTMLSGITDEMLQDAPLIEAVLPECIQFIGLDIIVGHNISFDLSFLQPAAHALGLPLDNDYVDTLQLSRRLCPELENHKLCTLQQHFGVENPEAHRALSDCLCTHDCYQKLRELLGSSPLPQQITKRKSRISAHICPGDFVMDPACAVEGSPLCGKIIVFTGELSISRQEAAQLAVNAGAVLKTSVSFKTDYLVIGKQDISLVGDDGLSTKQEKALRLNAEGRGHIKFLTEAEFLSLAGKEPVSV